jgi:uncharacterized OB-fold protein
LTIDTGRARPAPIITRDTEFWWAGVREHELRIQRCTACTTLRHPPDPGCWNCGSLSWDWIVSSGRGTLHSYVVYHTPQLEAFDYPNCIALVALEEGVRLVANLVDVDPLEFRIGLPVEVFYRKFADLTLPQFRPAQP